MLLAGNSGRQAKFEAAEVVVKQVCELMGGWGLGVCIGWWANGRMGGVNISHLTTNPPKPPITGVQRVPQL